MTNGLMEVCREVEPGYPGPGDDAKGGIYLHMQKAIKILIEMNHPDYPPCVFVGQTRPDRIELRFYDGDYSHCPENVELDNFLLVHPELTDHYVRARLYAEGCRKTILGGSREVVVAPLWCKSYSQLVDYISRKIAEYSEYFYESEKAFGYTPESQVSRIKEKNPEAVRAPQLHIVNEMIGELDLKFKSKDVMIFVPKDAFGHFCIQLTRLGYTNVYTDTRILDSCPRQYIPDGVTILEEEEYKKMKKLFDAVIGNPPYGNQGLEAVYFLAQAGDLIKDDGLIYLVLPKSIRKERNQNHLIKRNPLLHCVSDVDCDPKDFPASIDATKQMYVITDEEREIIDTSTSHPDFRFLKYVERFNANVFVGRIGGGPCGKVKTEDFTHYAKGHYFIRASSQQVIDNLVSLQDKFIAKSKEGSNGRRSLSKHELVTIYSENFDAQESTQSKNRIVD